MKPNQMQQWLSRHQEWVTREARKTPLRHAPHVVDLGWTSAPDEPPPPPEDPRGRWSPHGGWERGEERDVDNPFRSDR